MWRILKMLPCYKYNEIDINALSALRNVSVDYEMKNIYHSITGPHKNVGLYNSLR